MKPIIEGSIDKTYADEFRQTLENFAVFIGANRIVYKDNGTSESLEIYKDLPGREGQQLGMITHKFVLTASGNRYDGGFFSFPTKPRGSQVYGPEPLKNGL
jgi:hypothetical protein